MLVDVAVMVADLIYYGSSLGKLCIMCFKLYIYLRLNYLNFD